MSIIARNLFFSAVWNLGDVDHIASLCCSSKYSPEVINVIPCNTDSTLGISGEEVSKAVSHSHCKWRELLRNLSHPLPSHSSPSLGQKLKTKKWSDRKDLKNLFFFFLENQKSSLEGHLSNSSHVLRPNPFLLSFLIQSGNTPDLQ